MPGEAGACGGGCSPHCVQEAYRKGHTSMTQGLTSSSPPVLLSYEPSVDLYTLKAAQFPDASKVQTCGHLLLRPPHKTSLLSRDHSPTARPTFLDAHWPAWVTWVSCKLIRSQEEGQFGGSPGTERNSRTDVSKVDAHYSIHLLPPLSQSLGVCLDPSP